MTLTEKAAYLKGLRDGMNLNTDSNEGKLLNALIDLVSDMALTVEDLEETTLAISDELDEVEDEIDEIESYLDEDFSFGFDDEEDGDLFPDEDGTYELKCPNCEETIVVDEEALENGFVCPECGAQLDFDIEDEEDGEDGEILF